MKINLNNYEAFFLDYKEGSLSHVQEKELFLFLEQHPHLYEELHGFENIALEDLVAEESFVNKNSLKKPDFSNENLIAYAEGILNESDKKQIEDIALQNKVFNRELTFYINAKLQPDLNEKFKNKTKLKRGGVIIALQNNYTFLRVAAAVLLLVGLFFLIAKLNTKEEINKNKVEVAEADKKAEGNTQEEGRGEEQGQRSKVREQNKNLAFTNDFNSTKQSNPKQKTRNNNSEKEINSVVSNSVQTNSVAVNNNIKNLQQDSVSEKIILAESNNNKKEDQNLNRSYYNYSADKEEEEVPVTASVKAGKRSFFQKLVKVAKKVNDLGVKNVDVVEENDSNSLSIGSFVVAETISANTIQRR